MSTSLKGQLTDLLTYTGWANRRVFDAVLELSAEERTREIGGSFGTVRATLAHLIAAEWVWLRRWQGTSPAAGPEWANAPAPVLVESWEGIEAERVDWMTSQTDESLVRELAYRRLGGEPSTSRLDLLIRHVVNHSSYHRGQLAAFIRMLGGVPPSTDLILWDREREAAG